METLLKSHRSLIPIGFCRLCLYFFLGLSLGSCLKVVDLDVEETPKLLVVNCFFTDGEPFVVHVSRLAPYPDLNDRTIRNAKVTLYADDIFAGTLPFVKYSDDKSTFVYSSNSVRAQRGVLYKIQVESSGYPVATATDSLPGSVKVDSAFYIPAAGLYDDGLSYDQFSIVMNDTPQTEYYLIQILGLYDYGNSREYGPMDIFSDDPVIVAEGITGSAFKDYFVFTESIFKNTKYRLKINVPGYLTEDSKLFKVALSSGTVHYFQYLKRLNNHESYSYQDPFTPYDPVQLYSNVENGTGIFAGYSTSLFDLK